MDFAKILAYLRKERGFTQAKLAEKIGVSRQAVSKWESGLTFPEKDKLQLLAQALGVTVESLLGQPILTGTQEEPSGEVPEIRIEPARPMHISLFAACAVSILSGVLCLSLLPEILYEIDPTSILLMSGNWLPVTVGLIPGVMGLLVWQNREQLAPGLPRLVSITCLLTALGAGLIAALAGAFNAGKFLFFDSAHGLSTPFAVHALCALPFLLGIIIPFAEAVWVHKQAKK